MEMKMEIEKEMGTGKEIDKYIKKRRETKEERKNSMRGRKKEGIV